MDVGVGPDPLLHAPVLAADRDAAYEHVAVGAVMAAEAVLGLEEGAGLEGVLPGLDRGGLVVRVDHVEPPFLGDLRLGLARELGPAREVVRAPPVRPYRPHEGGGGADERAVAGLFGTEPLLYRLHV